MRNYFDDFADWEPGPKPEPQFEAVKARSCRLEAFKVTWRGDVITFEPEARLMFGRRTTVVSPVVLWPPTVDAEHPFPRESWTADVHIIGFGFIEARGETAQGALDALSNELPDSLTGMVRGGSC